MPTPAQSGSSINHKRAVEAVDKEQVQLPYTYPFSDLLPEAIRKDDDFESSPSAWHNPCSKDGDQNLGRMDMHSYTTLTEAEIELRGKQSEGCPKDTGVIFPTSSNKHFHALGSLYIPKLSHNRSHGYTQDRDHWHPSGTAFTYTHTRNG